MLKKIHQIEFHVQAQFPCGVRSFSLVIQDDSNYPTLSVGDAIVIDPDHAPVPGDLVLVTDKTIGVVLRKFQPRRDFVSLAPHNEDWPTEQIPALTPENYLGAVTEIARSARKK